MRTGSSLLLLLVAALGLSACQAPNGGTAGNAFAAAPTLQGPLRHRDSGFSFPERIGSFQRVNVHRYDAAGRDVSVGYDCELPRIAATLYVYPANGLSLEKEFRRRQAEIQGVHPTARLLARGGMSVSQRHVPARSAEYAFQDSSGGPDRSLLLVARRGERFVEYRFTYPAESQQVAKPLCRQFARDYAWP